MIKNPGYLNVDTRLRLAEMAYSAFLHALDQYTVDIKQYKEWSKTTDEEKSAMMCVVDTIAAAIKEIEDGRV